MADLLRYLARAVLDEAFAELAKNNPDASFAGYELSDDAKDALRARDARVLSLLADAIGFGSPRAAGEPATAGGGKPRPYGEETETAGTETQAPGPGAPTSSSVSFVVHVVPQRVEGPDGSAQIAFNASIHAPANAPAPRAPEIAFEIALQPQELQTANGPALAWGTTVSPWPRPERAPTPTSAEPVVSWRHRTDSLAARSAADAVRGAAPGERYAALLKLAEVLRGGHSPPNIPEAQHA